MPSNGCSTGRDRKLKINISVSKRFRKENERYEVIKEAGEPWITSSSADYIKPYAYHSSGTEEGMADTDPSYTPEPERQTRTRERINRRRVCVMAKSAVIVCASRITYI